MRESQAMKKIAGAVAVAVVLMTGHVYGQNCVPDEYCQYPPEANVTLTIGSPCDSTARINIPINLENPCPVGGFEMYVVLSNTGNGVHFEVGDSLAADTIGSRNTGWGNFSFNVLSASTIKVVAIGPGGLQPSLPSGNGLIFTVHPKQDGPVNDCQTVRYGAYDFVYDTLGYCSYGIEHVTGSLCVGCDSAWPRGDANRSGLLNIADVIALFSHLKGGTRLCFGGCICTGDFNNSGSINIADVISMFSYLRGIGDPPVPCD